MNQIIEHYFNDEFDKNEFSPPASFEKIIALEKALKIKLPADYKEFLLTTNGFEGVIGKSYAKFNKVEEIEDQTKGYCEEFFLWAIHIGTNLGGEMYVLDKRKDNEFGIIPYISSEEDLIPLGNDFEEFIKHLYNDDFRPE